MNEWKSWSRQFERDMREAAESVRASFAAGDPADIASGATEFAKTIVECAVTPLAAFINSVPCSLDFEWRRGQRWAPGREWDDEA